MGNGNVVTVAVNICDELRLCAPRHAKRWVRLMGRQDRDSQIPGPCAILDLVLIKHPTKCGGADIFNS